MRLFPCFPSSWQTFFGYLKALAVRSENLINRTKCCTFQKEKINRGDCEIRMSKPKEYSWMTKDKLMLYTLIALAVLAGLSTLTFGFDAIIVALVSVGVALGVDLLISKVAADSTLNLPSAAVFGLVVACSYTLGLPTLGFEGTTYPVNITMQGAGLYIFPALISLIGMAVFKKAFISRKFVNPAATAKLIVLLFLVFVALIPNEHSSMFPSLTSSVSLNGGTPFGLGQGIQQCFTNTFSAYGPDGTPSNTVAQGDVLYTLAILKYHGWMGGISSIAVLIVGIALFAIARRYIKWRITAAYFVATAVVAFALSVVYADSDPILRAAFHLFIGSSIFLGFFMATDPATTPLTHTGQLLFGVGLGVLSVLIVTYMTGFFGGSILALIIMNLTSPLLDKVGKLKPTTESKEPKLPKAMQQTNPKLYECIRCGACMRVCCHKLSPILIKQAFDKMNIDQLSKLNADYCTGCGHCSFVCPARIDLKGAVLRSKAMLRQQ
jgi:electron transport complex protein RnfD